LLQAVWPDTSVEPGILSVYIAALRKALDDDFRQPTCVETVPRHGYRFIAPVTTIAGPAPRPPSRTTSPQARECVERGRRLLFDGSHPALEAAVQAFRDAIASDKRWAAGYAGLAVTRCAQARVQGICAKDAYDEAKAAALRALALDEACGEARVALGTVLLLSEWDWAGAERSLKRALDVLPDFAEAHLWYGALLEATGRADEGLESKRRALDCVPDSPAVLTEISISYFHQRRYDDALAWARRALQHNPVQPLAYNYEALSLLRKGDRAGFSDAAVDRASRLGRPITWGQPGKPANRRDAILNYLADTTRSRRSDGATAGRLALVSGFLGDLTLAFQQLDAAMAEREAVIIYLAVSPLWDDLRTDPRFDERVRALGLPMATPGRSLAERSGMSGLPAL
jgi:tetratricopeptide (TPR) repeat protein